MMHSVCIIDREPERSRVTSWYAYTCAVVVTDAGSVVLDFSGQTLTEMVPLADARPLVLIYDKNHITGIASLEHCEHCLEQVRGHSSVSHVSLEI